MSKYTSQYGKVEYPTLTYEIPPPYAGCPCPGFATDMTFPGKLVRALGNRWLIVHIQRAYDGDPSCPPSNGGAPVVDYSLYMDNFGQVWKIYTKRGHTEQQQKLFIPLNTSRLQLDDETIDLAKTTLGPWLGRTIKRPEGLHPPEIPPKDVLDAFVNRKAVIKWAPIQEAVQNDFWEGLPVEEDRGGHMRTPEYKANQLVAPLNKCVAKIKLLEKTVSELMTECDACAPVQKQITDLQAENSALKERLALLELVVLGK